MKRLLLAALCVAFAGLGPLAAEPAVKRDMVHYEVDGATAEAIRAELNRLGPIGRIEKRRFDAHTLWNVKWTYRYRNVGSDCAIARVTVTVDVTITLPRLKPNAVRPAEVTRAFEDFAKALLAHEEGHAQIGIEAARRIETEIQGIKPHPTCDALGRAANALGDSLVKEANQKDVEYDARTQHGRSQGARFP
jgi:predicted secreted Zn-dependent protease